MELIRETMQQWYMVLSQISFSLNVPIKQVADGIQIPILKINKEEFEARKRDLS